MYNSPPLTLLRNPCRYLDQSSTGCCPLNPLNIPWVRFRFLLPVWGSAPKTKIFRHTLNANWIVLSGPNFAGTSTCRPTNISQSLGSVLITLPPKCNFSIFAPLTFLVNYERYRLRFFAIFDISLGLQNRTKNFGNTTSGLGSTPKNENFTTPSQRQLKRT